MAIKSKISLHNPINGSLYSRHCYATSPYYFVGWGDRNFFSYEVREKLGHDQGHFFFRTLPEMISKPTL